MESLVFGSLALGIIAVGCLWAAKAVASRGARLLPSPAEAKACPDCGETHVKPKVSLTQWWGNQKLPLWVIPVVLVVAVGFLLLQLKLMLTFGTQAPSLYRIFCVLGPAACAMAVVVASGLQRWRGLLAIVILLPAAEVWFWHPSMVTLDVAGAISAVGILAIIYPTKVTTRHVLIVATVSLAVLVYDVVSVFATGAMQEVAAQGLGTDKLAPTPGMFIVPASWGSSAQDFWAIGVGDVVTPGLLLMTAARLAQVHGRSSLWWGSLTGYAVGLLASNVVVRVTGMGQPATIYLIPGAALGLVAALWYNRRGLEQPLLAR